MSKQQWGHGYASGQYDQEKKIDEWQFEVITLGGIDWIIQHILNTIKDSLNRKESDDRIIALSRSIEILLIHKGRLKMEHKKWVEDHSDRIMI